MTARQKQSVVVFVGFILVICLGLASLGQQRKGSIEAKRDMLSVLPAMEGYTQNQAYLIRLVDENHSTAFHAAEGDKDNYVGTLLWLMIRQCRHDARPELVTGLQHFGRNLGVDPALLQ
jgi:hypothetical protein